VAVVGGVVAVVMKTTESFRTTAAVEIKTSHPTLAPTPVSWTNGVKEQIEEMVQLMAKENVMAGNADNLDEDDPILPYRLAMSWILEKDIRRLQKDSPNIIQRYLLALLYYSTDKEKDWKYCAPLDEGVVETNENTLCEAEMYDHDGEPFNKTARRFLSGAHECDWYGVDCPGGDQFVRVVEMNRNNLTGTLPPELALMPVLQHIAFIDNSLTGNIPSDYGKMKNLINLELTFNDLSGSIPKGIWEMESLLILSIGENELTGSIPPEISNLKSITGLHTHQNQLTGSIPTEIGKLEYLVRLDMSSNIHTGTLPTEIGNLSELDLIDFVYNKFTGFLPTTLGNLRKLKHLYLNNNQFNGTLPIQFYNLVSLERFFGDGNSFSGTLSPLIGRLESLEDFIIHRNHFSGTIPNELTGLVNMTHLWLYFNNFMGTTSDAFCDMYKLTSFYTDCGPTDIDNPPFVKCDCCSNCCDAVQETCLEVDRR